ncbi:MAG: trehalose-6-phosphate synthase [Candidatus Limnocylindria bacterium]
MTVGTRRRAAPDEALADAARTLLGDRRLVIAANRGPVSFSTGSDGSLRPRRGSGGLVTALGEIGRYVPLTWVAAAMTDADRRAAEGSGMLERAVPEADVRLRFVTTDRATYEAGYNVIANPLLWFLQHQMWNLPEQPQIDARVMRAWQQGYAPINSAFARAAVAAGGDDEQPRIMLHDYHLYLAAAEIRRQRPEALISHFTHIPWPPSSLWQVMPPFMRTAICDGLCANDIVGFQTQRYRHNFLRTVESFLPGAQVDYANDSVTWRGRVTWARCYPISIDVEATRALARSAAADHRREDLRRFGGEFTLVRVDRLEPSKNILRGFLAYEALVTRHPEYRGRVNFLAFLVPSRTSLREYGDYGRRVQEVVDRINARFGSAVHRPIHLFYENDYVQALAGLSIADVVLVNPLIDGMNLVAKEAVTVTQRNAVLVLSETAGAYDQMSDGALPVAPADVIGTADAIAAGLSMPAEERARRIRLLRDGVEREDIAWWLRRQLTDLAQVAETRAPAAS